MKDARIVDLYWKRSERAIDESRKKYGAFCNAVALGITRDKRDADECEADAYQGAWESIPDKRPQKLGPFLGKIARNSALSKWRLSHTDKRGGGEVPEVLDDIAEFVPDRGGVDSALESTAIAKTVSSFLRAQPAQKRKCFVQRYWYDRTVAEIAADLGMSETNVTTTLARLREQLKAELGERGVEL